LTINTSLSDTMSMVEAPLTNGSNGIHTNGTLQDGPVEPVITFDPSIFRSYLHALLPPLLAVLPEELESIFDDEFDERVSRFAGEGGGTVYVVKKKDEAEGVYRHGHVIARVF
jgi:hypothetical protein